ncbi:hypothetical protein [Streptacidiphilus sp. MAP12-16]|uniref:hypothetical protein n=1 Tax=Streptacidiphilus sp. MAP12-16 TaxID=3156300 RepID=UPI003519A894
MDSAAAGTELNVGYPGGGLPDQAPVQIPSGRWTVRAIRVQADSHTWVGLVQLLPAGA